MSFSHEEHGASEDVNMKLAAHELRAFELVLNAKTKLCTPLLCLVDYLVRHAPPAALGKPGTGAH